MEDSMEPSSKGRRNLLLQTTGALISGALLLPTGAQAQSNHRNWKGTSGYRYGGPNRGPNLPQHYTQTNLVSDSPNTAIAKTYDPRLRSAWGMAQSSTGPWWVNNEASGLTTVYSGEGDTQSPFVRIPIAEPTKSQVATPTGIVFNPSQGFLLANGRPAKFLMCTLDGLIVGWNEGLPNNTAQVLVNHAGTSIYEGFAIAPATFNGVTSTYLYVPDFKASQVDVYDERMQRVPALERAINSISKPSDFAPFNVATVGPNLYITYAKPDSTFAGLFPIVEAGNGIVAAFSPEGKLLQVLEHSNILNGPWAVTLAPGNFGLYSHYLLVGNNGDGRINVYNALTGTIVDQLRDASNNPIEISGLWGMQFGNNTEAGGSATSLYFTASAGVDFTHGLFGKITPVQNAFGNGN